MASPAPAHLRLRAPPEQAAPPPPATAAEQSYLAGDVIGEKYQLVSVLGEGGMGSVWLAHNSALDVDVAIKLIKREAAAVGASERLLQEARASARLGHPSIVRVFDFGKTDRGDPYIVMEVLAGYTFGEFLDRRGRLPALNAVRLLLPVASALCAAHAQGVVHRDMKPDNVMIITSEGGGIVPKVVDFGIAKFRREDAKRQVTAAGVVLGSPDYMSPEQARGHANVDQRADVWALTVMLYEAITGRRPFEGPNYNALMTAVILESPVPSTEFAAGDEELWAILDRGFEKEPSKRWPTMRALGSALAAWAIERGADDDVAGSSLRAHWLCDAPDPPTARVAYADALDDMVARLDEPARRSAPAFAARAPASQVRTAPVPPTALEPAPGSTAPPTRTAPEPAQPSASRAESSPRETAPGAPSRSAPATSPGAKLQAFAAIALVAGGVATYASLGRDTAAEPAALSAVTAPAAPVRTAVEAPTSAAPPVALSETPAASASSSASPARAPIVAPNVTAKKHDKPAAPAKPSKRAAASRPPVVPDTPNF